MTNLFVCAECVSNYRMEQLIMFLILGMVQKLYSMKGSSPDTFGYRDPQKAHGIPAVLDFYSFSLARIETIASKVKYVTLKCKPDITEGNKRKEERPEILY